MRFTVSIDTHDDEELEEDPDFNPDHLRGCAYWRCDELFERRSLNHRFCRKACRSRQRKWEKAQARRAARLAAKESA